MASFRPLNRTASGPAGGNAFSRIARDGERAAGSELGEESRVVLVEQADVVDPVAPHAEALDAEAEGEPGDLLGIVADRAEDIGIDHAGAPHLDPAVAAVPHHVDLDGGLG